MTTRRRCPVCMRRVTRTPRGNVAGHLDTAGKPCPFSGIGYDLTLRDTA